MGKNTTGGEVRAVREADAQVIMEERECTLVYFHTDKLLFSVSTLFPGDRSALDPGHVGAEEVVYVVDGTIVMEFPATKRFVKLQTGDALLIPDSEPHLFHNVGAEPAKLTWATAPHLGRGR
jgi:mannose-6-phosphate isomerase-like protein (cupin superfamily)